jgi:hypothetical protein
LQYVNNYFYKVKRQKDYERVGTLTENLQVSLNFLHRIDIKTKIQNIEPSDKPYSQSPVI